VGCHAVTEQVNYFQKKQLVEMLGGGRDGGEAEQPELITDVEFDDGQLFFKNQEGDELFATFPDEELVNDPGLVNADLVDLGSEVGRFANAILVGNTITIDEHEDGDEQEAEADEIRVYRTVLNIKNKIYNSLME
jgi:hypothetical protein